jgi:hypothetical protein
MRDDDSIMNRRDFLGTVGGGIMAAKLGASGWAGYEAESALVNAANANAEQVNNDKDRNWT